MHCGPLGEMEDLAVYHGAIGMEEGERRLGLDGRDGCYLVRTSDTVPGSFCLCVLCGGYVYTYRLHRDSHGSWAADTTPGVQKRYFHNIKNLISAFQKPGQGLAMPLLFPVTTDTPVVAADGAATFSFTPPHLKPASSTPAAL